MKIRVGKLKRLIVEAVEGEGSVELTTDPDAAHAAWPEVTWNGLSIIDKVYPLTKTFEDAMQSRDWDFQEVYLGYIPAKDAFIIGWDVWPPDDRHGDPIGMISAYQVFHVMTHGDQAMAVPIGKLEECETGFYSRKGGGGLEVIHEEIPNVIDLRLD